MTFDEDEAWRILRVRMCEWLHITPPEWDAIPYPDQCDLIEVWRANRAIQQDKARNPKAPRNRSP